MTPKNRFDHIVILKNSASTHIRTAERLIKGLEQLLPNATTHVVETAKSVADTRTRLLAQKDVLGPKTLFCIAGGDGTVNQAVEFLLGTPDLPAKARRTVLLPLWAGNANDLAHMANGPAFRTRLPALFTSGKTTAIYPLVINLKNSEGYERIYHAVSYAGFGVTAAFAKEINRYEHRRQWWQHLFIGKLVGEVATGIRFILGFDDYSIEENDVTYHLYERTYVNGTRMGKFYPFAARLTERHFVQTTAYKKDNRVVALYYWLIGALRANPVRKTAYKSSFGIQDTIWMHVDGEPVRVHKNTDVTVRCSHTPVHVLSTRLQRSKPATKRKPKRSA